MTADDIRKLLADYEARGPERNYAHDDLLDAAPDLARRALELEEVLEAIAAEAYVSADDWPLGWRRVATERIDIARAALKETNDD